MIIRKEFVRAAVGYSAGAPKIDETGNLIPTKGVYDVLCDTVSDVVSDETLAVGTMAYVRIVAEGADHKYVKVADNGESADWETVDQAPESNDDQTEGAAT